MTERAGGRRQPGGRERETVSLSTLLHRTFEELGESPSESEITEDRNRLLAFMRGADPVEWHDRRRSEHDAPRASRVPLAGRTAGGRLSFLNNVAVAEVLAMSPRVPVDPSAAPAGHSTVVQLVLGARLRRLRRQCGMSRTSAARLLGMASSRLTQIELGRTALSERDLTPSLDLYGVTDARVRESLLNLARRTDERGWWQRYNDPASDWLETLISLEAIAGSIRKYETQCVPDLLQTPDYARACIRRTDPRVTDRQLDRRVATRMERQKRLTQPGAPILRVVMDEAALLRRVGGVEVMRAQLHHLAYLSGRANIDVRIAALHSARPVAGGHAATALRLADVDSSVVVYLEQLNSALYLDPAAGSESYVALIDRMRDLASPARQTHEYLAHALEYLDGPPP